MIREGDIAVGVFNNLDKSKAFVFGIVEEICIHDGMVLIVDRHDYVYQFYGILVRRNNVVEELNEI